MATSTQHWLRLGQLKGKSRGDTFFGFDQPKQFSFKANFNNTKLDKIKSKETRCSEMKY